MNVSRAHQRGTWPVIGAAILFATNGALFASILPLYPSVVSRLDLTAGYFGLLVAAYPLGALLSSHIPSILTRRIGVVALCVASTTLLAIALCVAATATLPAIFTVALLIAGFADTNADVAQNLAGLHVQDLQSRSILSSLHAVWSLGGVAGGAISTALLSAGTSTTLHMIGMSGGSLLLAIVGAALVRPALQAFSAERSAQDHAARSAPGSRWSLVRAMLPFAILAASGTLVEEVANSWAALSLIELTGFDPSLAGIGFVVMIGSQCVGRFTGDLLIDTFGSRHIATFGSALITAGSIVILFGAHAATLLLGLALVGLGSATLVPIALTAAATARPHSKGSGVTFVSWMMRLGFLLTSPIIGGITETANLRAGFWVVAAAGMIGLLSVRALATGHESMKSGDERSAQ